jgi:dTMP kinase
MSAKRGLFVLFEGVDRCGKTTQAKLLTEKLNALGEKAIFMRFPDRDTAIGGQLNAYLARAAELDDHAVHLLFAANRWEKKADILSALRAGTHVVMDRYAYSGVAFSSGE